MTQCLYGSSCVDLYLLNIFSIIAYGVFCRLLKVSLRQTGLILFTLVGVQLLLLSILRSIEVGGDLVNYIPTFKNIAKHSWSGLLQDFGFEPGYVILNKMCSIISNSEYSLLFACGLICVFLYIRFLRRSSKIPYLSLLLFVCLGFFTSSLSMLRQSIAMALVLNSLPYIEHRQIWRFFLIIGLAVSFHFTALIFIILYPISRIKISWGYFTIVLVGAALFGLTVGRTALAIVINQLYTTYEEQIISGEGYSMLIFFCGVTFWGMLIRTYMEPSERKEQDIYYHMMILACGLQFLSLQFSLFSRIVLYFSTALMVFIPNSIASIRNLEMKILFQVVWIGFAFFYFAMIIAGINSSGIVPYTFFWE